jgi:hypothetical protein
MSNGAHIHQWDWVNANNQKWRIESLGSGLYKVTSYSSGKALDVSAASTADGAILNQWDYVGAANQKWQIEDLGGGNYRLIASHSGKVIHIGSTTNGTKFVQSTWNNSNNQKFTLQYLSATRSVTEEEEEVISVRTRNSFYPNPAENVLHLTDAEEVENVEIISTVSSSLLKLSKNEMVSEGINISELKAGVYFIRTVDKKGKITVNSFVKK